MQRPSEKPDFPTALSLIKNKNYTEALILLQKMNQTPPVLLAKSSCFLAQKRFKEARDAILSIKGTKTLVHLERLALCHARLGEYHKAFAIYDQMPEKSQNVLYDCGYCYLETGDYVTALYYFNKITKKTNGLSVCIARCEELSGNVKNAIAIYQSIKEHDLNSLISFARCYQNQGNFTQALALLESVSHKGEEIVLALGRCYQSCNRLQDAISLYRNYLKNNSKCIPVAHELARCYRDHREFETAVREFKELLKSNPNDPDLLLSLGLCYELMEEYDLAIQTLKKIIQPTGKVLIAIGRSLIELGRVAEAHAICKNFPTTYLEGQLSFAICLNHMQQHEQAISVITSIKDWSKNRKTLFALAQIYHQQDNISLAIDTFKQIPGWQFDEEVLLAIARVYRNKENFSAACATLDLIPINKRNPDSIGALAECKKQMGDYDTACKLILSAPNYSNNRNLAWLLGSCYQEMGQVPAAIAIFKSFKVHTLKIQIALSICYEMIGNFDDMLLCLNAIELKNKTVLITMGRAYQKIGMFNEAVKIFKSIPNWETDSDALLGLGICYNLWGDPKTATHYLTSIKNWQQQRKVLLSLSRCYQSANFDQAVNYIYMLPSWNSDKQAMLGLAILNGLHKKFPEAEKKYLDLIHNFPFFADGYFYYAKAKLNDGSLNDILFLDECIKKFPYYAGFYQLKAVYFFKNNQKQAGKEILELAIQRFPFNYQLSLSLLRYYLYAGAYDFAETFYQACAEKYRGNPKLAKIFSGIMFATRGVSIEKYTYFYDQTVLYQTELLEPMKEAFSRVKPFVKEKYIVGSAVLNALENKPLKQHQDIDLVVLTSNLGYFATNIASQKIIQNDFAKYLFTGKLTGTPPVHLDCYVMTLPMSDDFLTSNCLFRDFTICCLYLDEDGYVIDPTGCGLQDFKDKLLRTISDPFELFDKDPLRILRAIKYILRGFKPTQELVRALLEWQPTERFDHNQLISSLYQYLKIDAERFVQELQNYKLLNKLFGINFSSVSDAIKQLQSLANQSSQNFGSVIQSTTPNLGLEKTNTPFRAQVKLMISKNESKSGETPAILDKKDWPSLMSKNENAVNTVPGGSRVGVWGNFQFNNVSSKQIIEKDNLATNTVLQPEDRKEKVADSIKDDESLTRVQRIS